MSKKTIVISAINFSEGGPLTVYCDLLAELSLRKDEFRVIALVHKKELFEVEGVEFIEFTDSKGSWLKRLNYEYFGFNKLSKRLKPDVWLSLHDITPRVQAGLRAVYCHNPSPFHRVSLKSISLDFKFFLFNKFYKYLYGLNIKANDIVFVQQAWLREEFMKRYGVKNVVVAYPDVTFDSAVEKTATMVEKNTFFYPSLARSFKNFELLCSAAEQVYEAIGDSFEVWITMSGAENKYARSVFERFKNVPVIKFLGRQTKAQMSENYNRCDVLVFPSHLETWGLPITEAKLFEKKVLLADLPYAHETLGEYDKSRFFDTKDPSDLAELMKAHISEDLLYQHHEALVVEPPHSRGWSQFVDILVSDKKSKDG
ncbi:glycosyltransferase [Roseivirga pacifica]|uniref:glycosyltransferase n=1 Tax=Roseivirga pacifica TaxID=1267423 RepID=UPI003BAA77D4